MPQLLLALWLCAELASLVPSFEWQGTKDALRPLRSTDLLSWSETIASAVRTLALGVVLVMQSFDVPRARAEFLRAGIEVIPAPTGIPSGEIEWPGDFLPGVGGLTASYYACYELAALMLQSSTR